MIQKIVITGGPCGGKTSGLNAIKKHFQEKGYNVLTVFELPTLLVNSGAMIKMRQFNRQQQIQFQSRLVQAQIYNENYMEKIAKMFGSKTIIICDRGTYDFTAYVDPLIVQAIFDSKGWNPVLIRDSRYSAVLFLASVADGAQKFYTSQNNQARYQSLDQAKDIDSKTRKAYLNHHNFCFINNDVKSFQQKLKKAIDAIDAIICGHKKPKQILSVQEINFTESIQMQKAQIKYIVLKGTEKSKNRYAVRRGINSNYIYFLKEKQFCPQKKQFIINQIQIQPAKYLQLLQQADPAFNPVDKIRTSFIFQSNLYHIDQVVQTQKKYLLKEPEQRVPEAIVKVGAPVESLEFEISTIARKG